MAKKRNIVIKRMVRISPTRVDPKNGNKPFVARFKKISVKKPHKKSYKEIPKRRRSRIFETPKRRKRSRIFNKPLRKSFLTPIRKSLF